MRQGSFCLSCVTRDGLSERQVRPDLIGAGMRQRNGKQFLEHFLVNVGQCHLGFHR